MSFRTLVLGLEGRHTGLGFEDAEIEAAIEGDELVQSVQESTADEVEVTNDLATVERLEAQATGLEDIAAFNEEYVAEATEGEMALTEVAADLASVGTDIGGADVMVPALESFKGRRISMEGIKDTAKKIWAAIKAFIRKIWEKIVGFWRKITDQVPSVVKSAKKLQARAEATRGKVLKEKSDKTTISSSEGHALIVDDKKATGMSDLSKGLDNLKEVCGVVLDTHANRVRAAGDFIATKLSSFDLDKPEESLASLTKSVEQVMRKVDKAVDTPVNGDKRFSKDLAVYRSEHLFGNRAVFTQATRDAALTGSALGQAQLVRSFGVTLTASKEKLKDHTGEFEISTLTPGDCEKLADQIIDTMEVLKKFQSKSRRDLETGADKVNSAGDKIEKKPDDKTSPNAIKHYQSALQYGGTYAKWCASPFMSLLSHTLASSRTIISVANKSLSQYKA